VVLSAEDDEHHPIPWVRKPGTLDYNYPLADGTYYSGGGGLSSTLKDYAIFLQMLLNNGIYNGQRILSPASVRLMTTNQIGDLFVGKKDKFGLGFEIVTREGATKLGASEGSFLWGGYFGTSYWADPSRHLLGLLYLQQLPLTHYEIHDKFQALVYQALTD
jgi:CubicO group peptidase (beta-lactamase class C family)